MKSAPALILLFVLLLGGCATTRQGAYHVDVMKADAKSVLVYGQFDASVWVDWSQTRYTQEPKALVAQVIASLTPNAPAGSYEIKELWFTGYELSNAIGWVAVVTGTVDALRPLRKEVGRRVAGDFSFDDSSPLRFCSSSAIP